MISMSRSMHIAHGILIQANKKLEKYIFFKLHQLFI